MKENQIAVQLSHVGKQFKQFTAVDDLSLSVRRGEIFGLLGPNGAGKTTTIHMICGLLPNSSGKIDVMGFNPIKEARQVRSRIGLVAQETNLYFDLTAVENLEHHAALFCDDLSDLKTNIQKQLSRMQLWERRSEAVRQFSGGMKRRLALARALMHDPELIFFDEPTLGVDVQARHVLWQHIRDESAAGKTFVISTNDMNEADALCDRLAIIDQGKLIALDSPENLKNSLGRDVITLKTTPLFKHENGFFDGLGVQDMQSKPDGSIRLEVNNAEGIVGELISRLNGAYRLDALQVSRPSLDDVFLHYTGRGLRE